MNALDKNLDVVESQFYNNYCNSNRTCVKPITSIVKDVCWCGHNRNSHSGLNRCNEKDCNCKRFFP
jgi:hypothetical protein